MFSLCLSSVGKFAVCALSWSKTITRVPDQVDKLLCGSRMWSVLDRNGSATVLSSAWGKFAVKWILKIPPHFGHVATLPCETLMSAKPALHDNYKVIAAYLRCGGVVNNQNKKGLLLSLRVKIFFKSVNIWQRYEQERDCLMHFLHLLAVCWPGAQNEIFF